MNPDGTSTVENVPLAETSQKSQTTENGEQFHVQISTNIYLSFAAMCIIDLTEALDATSIAVVLPVIAAAFQASTLLTYLLSIAFLLCSTICQPIFHSLSVTFGQKPVLLISLVIFLLGAVVGGWAPNIHLLLAGRIIQGVGAAGCISLTNTVITELVPLRKRAPWIAILNIMWAIGSVSGPVIGGSLVEINWRWILWLNVPLVVAPFAILCIFLRIQRPLVKQSLVQKLSNLDYVGAILFFVSSTAISLSITLAGTVAPWISATILAPLIAGFLGLVLFIFQQKRLTMANSNTIPLIRLSIFSNRTTLIGYFATFVHGILLWMVVYYLPLYYEGVLGYSPLRAGIAGFPEALTIAPAAIITGLAISCTGTFVAAIRLGWIFAVGGMGGLCILSSRTPVYLWILLNIIPGIALGVLIPAGGIAIQAATATSDAGHAISMFYIVRGFGQTVGVAIGSTIVRYRLANVFTLAAFGGYGGAGPQATAEDLLRILKSFKQNGEDDRELIEGIVSALRLVWGVGAAMAGLAAVASFWMKDYSLDRKGEAKERT